MHTFHSSIQTPLGTLQLRCNDTHVQEISFREAVEARNDSHPLLQLCAEQLEAYFDGRLKTFDLPVAFEGSPFQQKVWTLLGDIPFGKTLSYLALAQQYGDVKAIRAVAAANGRNVLAVVVPCHRVIGSNRSLTGYAGGLWRKKWLLEHESRLYHGASQLSF